MKLDFGRQPPLEPDISQIMGRLDRSEQHTDIWILGPELGGWTQPPKKEQGWQLIILARTTWVLVITQVIFMKLKYEKRLLPGQPLHELVQLPSHQDWSNWSTKS